MSTELKILPKWRLVYAGLEGDWSVDQLRRQASLFVDAGLPRKTRGMIIETAGGDLSQVQLKDLKLFLLEWSRRARLPGDYRIALVAKADLAYGFGRVAQAVAALEKVDLRVFRTKVEALTYVTAGRLEVC